jgi:hypothetical protein
MNRRRWTDVAVDVFTAIAVGFALAMVFAFGPGGAFA